MFLAPDDLKLFFKLHRSLMFFVNQKLQVLSEPMPDAIAYSSLSPNAHIEVHEAFLKHRHLLEDYVRENPDDFRRRNWTSFFPGGTSFMGSCNFWETEKYAVCLSAQTSPIAYGVQALRSPFMS